MAGGSRHCLSRNPRTGEKKEVRSVESKAAE
jgi:hypothetical protein